MTGPAIARMVAVAFLVLWSAALARDRIAQATAALTVTVVQGTAAASPGSPVEHARVILTLPGGEESSGVTNASGEVRFDGLASGAIKVQVLKTGWETAGSTLDLAPPSASLKFSLKPDTPPAQ